MKKSKNVSVICKNCGSLFMTRVTEDRQHKFCSVECYRQDWKKRIPGWNKGLKTGQTPWNKGKKYSLGPNLLRRGIRVSQDTEFKYKNGSGAYVLLHNWVKKSLGKPQKCDICKKIDAGTYHWANKSGKYKKDLSDWMRLCVACHKKFDIGRNWSLYKTFYQKYRRI